MLLRGFIVASTTAAVCVLLLLTSHVAADPGLPDGGLPSVTGSAAAPKPSDDTLKDTTEPLASAAPVTASPVATPVPTVTPVIDDSKPPSKESSEKPEDSETNSNDDVSSETDDDGDDDPGNGCPKPGFLAPALVGSLLIAFRRVL